MIDDEPSDDELIEVHEEAIIADWGYRGAGTKATPEQVLASGLRAVFNAGKLARSSGADNTGDNTEPTFSVNDVRRIIHRRAIMLRERAQRFKGNENDSIRRVTHNQIADLLDRYAKRFPHLAGDIAEPDLLVARSSGVADTPKDLDPTPWTWGDAETPVGHVRQSWSDHWHKGFAPRPEYEQDPSKYPHMQGVANTVKEEDK